LEGRPDLSRGGEETKKRVGAVSWKGWCMESLRKGRGGWRIAVWRRKRSFCRMIHRGEERGGRLIFLRRLGQSNKGEIHSSRREGKKEETAYSPRRKEKKGSPLSTEIEKKVYLHRNLMLI